MAQRFPPPFSGLSGGELRIFSREERQFVGVPELDAQRQQAEERAERLAAQFRALGVEPEQ